MSNRSAVRFIVLFLGRTGSTMLIEALDSHSRITARGEAFKNNQKKGPVRQVSRIRGYFGSPEQNMDALGFKVKYRAIGDRDAVADLLREFDARVIHLQRRNQVKHVVSSLNALRLFDTTSDWNLYSREDRLGPFEIDAVDFAKRLEGLELARELLAAYIAELDLPTLCVAYEDLLTSRESTFGKVFDFLGVSLEPVESAALKNTPDDLRLVVENFLELRDRYRGTEYEAMFDEILLGAPNASEIAQ